MKRKWELTDDDCHRLFKGDCFYCGHPPTDIFMPNGHKRYRNYNGQYLHNGIDRFDNDKDYVVDNCVSCCKGCNYMKRAMTAEVFLAHIYRIAAHQHHLSQIAPQSIVAS